MKQVDIESCFFFQWKMVKYNLTLQYRKAFPVRIHLPNQFSTHGRIVICEHLPVHSVMFCFAVVFFSKYIRIEQSRQYRYFTACTAKDTAVRLTAKVKETYHLKSSFLCTVLKRNIMKNEQIASDSYTIFCPLIDSSFGIYQCGGYEVGGG